MPKELTIFAASDLIYITVALAAVALAALLWRRPRRSALRWAVAAVIVLVLSLVFSRIGGAIYNDPRPFTTSHVPPLIAHAPDNGFPSDHALLAAAIVALMLLADPFSAVPFAVLAVLIDWARVGAGLHHVGDVAGSSLMVAAALLIAVAVAPWLAAAITPRVPAAWLRD
ncbi:MAG TPA: phosphatase PAP2 family protein [Dehalococcoidia bacterium]|jgi:undecaprenyl-diphosphatase|nr:phosphatase PAP2 family protein [Dehalococcoidia bacterium]